LPIPRQWPAHGTYGGIYPYPINTLYTSTRINPDLWAPSVERGKGFAALKGVLGELYGLTIDYYVAVDLKSFREVIDTLGGTMIDVQNPVFDYHYPADDGRSGHMKLYIPPGIQFMRGTEALAYARARKLTSDFDRAARQQRVITSLRDQVDLSALLAPGVIEELLKTLRSNIRTDVPPGKLPKLAQLAQEIDLDQRISLVLTPPYYGAECYLAAACPNDYQLVANVDRIRSEVRDLFKADRAEARQRERLIDEGAVVHVLNGTRSTNQRATRVADVLAGLGLDASVPPIAGGAADSDDSRQAVLIAWNGAADTMPLAGEVLARTMKVRVESREDPLVTADYTLIVGSTTEPPPR
jgi:LCP family protein required for cell wall assembly